MLEEVWIPGLLGLTQSWLAILEPTPVELVGSGADRRTSPQGIPRVWGQTGVRAVHGYQSETMWVLLVLDFTEEGPLFVSEACFPVLPPSRKFLSPGATWGLGSGDVGNFPSCPFQCVFLFLGYIHML